MGKWLALEYNLSMQLRLYISLDTYIMTSNWRTLWSAPLHHKMIVVIFLTSRMKNFKYTLQITAFQKIILKTKRFMILSTKKQKTCIFMRNSQNTQESTKIIIVKMCFSHFFRVIYFFPVFMLFRERHVQEGMIFYLFCTSSFT